MEEHYFDWFTSFSWYMKMARWNEKAVHFFVDFFTTRQIIRILCLKPFDKFRKALKEEAENCHLYTKTFIYIPCISHRNNKTFFNKSSDIHLYLGKKLLITAVALRLNNQKKNHLYSNPWHIKENAKNRENLSISRTSFSISDFFHCLDLCLFHSHVNQWFAWFTVELC